jgi:hypothetical protein
MYALSYLFSSVLVPTDEFDLRIMMVHCIIFSSSLMFVFNYLENTAFYNFLMGLELAYARLL